MEAERWEGRASQMSGTWGAGIEGGTTNTTAETETSAHHESTIVQSGRTKDETEEARTAHALVLVHPYAPTAAPLTRARGPHRLDRFAVQRSAVPLTRTAIRLHRLVGIEILVENGRAI